MQSDAVSEGSTDSENSDSDDEDGKLKLKIIMTSWMIKTGRNTYAFYKAQKL